MELNIQMDYHARHRIILQESDSSLVVEGEWANYRSLAVLQHNGKTYIAGTEYGLLPQAETVYEITPVDTTLDMSMQYTDAQGVEHKPPPPLPEDAQPATFRPLPGGFEPH